MKKEKNALYILRLAVTLLAICAAVALALAGVNAITKDRIAAIQAEKTQKAIAEVLPGVTDVEEIAFTDESGLVSTVYKSDLGYAVEVTPTSGFAGAIKMMVGSDRFPYSLIYIFFCLRQNIAHIIKTQSNSGCIMKEGCCSRHKQSRNTT